MGWLGSLGDGMVSYKSFSRIHRVLAAIRRTLRPLSRQYRRVSVQSDVGRTIPRLGLENTLPLEPHPGRRRPLHPTGGAGDADLHQVDGRTKTRTHPDA